jgi:hypothetical protein
MMSVTWSKFLGEGLRFFWQAKIGQSKYWVTFRDGSWQVEDDCGGVAGPFKSSSKAKHYVNEMAR